MMVDMYMFFHQAAKISAGAVLSKSFLERLPGLYLAMQKTALFLLCFFLLQTSFGAIVDTIEIRSNAMNKTQVHCHYAWHFKKGQRDVSYTLPVAWLWGELQQLDQPCAAIAQLR
jgi:hypothetical protein